MQLTPFGYSKPETCFICDNLSLRSDLMAPVRRKHTANGLDRFTEALQLAVADLNQFKDAESRRIKRFRETEITDTERDAVLLRSYDRGLISHRLLPDVIAESRKPSFDFGCPLNTLFVLEQAFTTVLGRTVLRSNAQRFLSASLAVQELLSEAAGIGADGPSVYIPA